MNQTTYSFDTKERQELKKPYSFTNFSSNFFNNYLKKRNEIIDSLRDDHSIDEYHLNNGYSLEELTELTEFDTPKVIRTLYGILIEDGSLDNLTSHHFWRILKKVEVRKLKQKYNINFINTSKQPLDLESYAVLSLTFGLYARNRNNGYLQSLSTNLKLNDFLISRKDDLISPLEQAVLLSSLELELEEVNKIREEISQRTPSKMTHIQTYKRESPIKLEKLGMFIQESNRSKAYIQSLLKSGLYPNFVLLLKDPNHEELLDTTPNNNENLLFNPTESEVDTLEGAGIDYREIKATSCNEPHVVEELKLRPEEIFVYSGRDILKNALNLDKKFIHVHPGKLSDYKGSTCHFYSVLDGNGWHCTSFIMSPEIDGGRIITSREFPLPRRDIDAARIYDPYTRSIVLIDTIKELADTGTLKTTSQNLEEGLTYYIIHPILEFIRGEYLDRVN